MAGELFYALVLVLPAMVSNAAPLLYGGGTPIATVIFGKNKTVRGLVAGLGGGIFGAVLLFALELFPFNLQTCIGIGILQGAGAMAGDLIGSFIKRRLKILEGDEMFLLDQLGFMVCAILFSNHIISLGIEQVLLVLIVTFVLHKATNVMAFLLKLKDRAH